jgi:hypothetical protein
MKNTYPTTFIQTTPKDQIKNSLLNPSGEKDKVNPLSLIRKIIISVV